MSGGRFNYMDSSLMDEIFGYSEKPRDVFEDMEISQLVWDVLKLIHDFDWYASGDSGEDDSIRRFWTSRPSEQQMRDTPWEKKEESK